MKSLITFLLLSCTLATTAFSQKVGANEEFTVVKDFSTNWHVYDESYQNYIPYIAERHFRIPAHVFFCDLEANLNYYLLLRCQGKNNFLFIEGTLQQKLPDNEWVVFPVRQLYEKYGKKQIYVTLYGSANLQTKWAGIVHRIPEGQVAKKNADGGFQLQPREISPFRSPISFIFILILGVFTYVSVTFPRMFEGFYNLRNFFYIDSRDQAHFAQKAFNRANVFFIIMLSLLQGLLYLMFESQGVHLLRSNWFLQDGQTAGVLLTNFFRVSLFMFLGMFLKYFFLVAMGSLFNIGKIVDLHFFKLLQTTLVFFSVGALLFLSLTQTYFKLDPTWQNWLFGGLVLFYVVRTVLIYFAINKAMPILTLYLISYLCIVEVIPIFIGLQLVYQP